MNPEPKAVVKMFIETCINGRDLDRLPEFFSHDFVDHTAPPELPTGIPGRRMWLTNAFGALQDLHANIDAQVSEGEWVASRVTSTGTHEGKKISTGIASFDRVVEGKIVEKWEYRDPGLQALIRR